MRAFLDDSFIFIEGMLSVYAYVCGVGPAAALQVFPSSAQWRPTGTTLFVSVRLSVCLSFFADVSIFTSGARAPARVLRFPRDFRERIA